MKYIKVLILVVITAFFVTGCGSAKQIELMEEIIEKQEIEIENYKSEISSLTVKLDKLESETLLGNDPTEPSISQSKVFELDEKNGPYTLHKVYLKQENDVVYVDLNLSSTETLQLGDVILEFKDSDENYLGNMTRSIAHHASEVNNWTRLDTVAKVEYIDVSWSIK